MYTHIYHKRRVLMLSGWEGLNRAFPKNFPVGGGPQKGTLLGVHAPLEIFEI